MWTVVAELLVKFATSEFAKLIIALSVKKLVEHKSDGITKDIAENMLDGIAKSRANDAPAELIDTVKAVL